MGSFSWRVILDLNSANLNNELLALVLQSNPFPAHPKVGAVPVRSIRSGIISPAVLSTALVILLNVVPGFSKLGVVSSFSWVLAVLLCLRSYNMSMI